MKPVILAFLLLVVILIGYAWMDGKFGKRLVKTMVNSEKSLYFEPALTLEVGKEGELNLMANYSGAPVIGFHIEFGYDPTLVKVSGFVLNKDIFDTLTEGNVDANFGRVAIVATSSRTISELKSGVQKLATIQMTGLKKGGMIMSSGRRPEVTIFEGGKRIEGDFQMQGFKVSVK